MSEGVSDGRTKGDTYCMDQQGLPIPQVSVKEQRLVCCQEDLGCNVQWRVWHVAKQHSVFLTHVLQLLQ